MRRGAYIRFIYMTGLSTHYKDLNSFCNLMFVGGISSHGLIQRQSRLGDSNK